MRRRTLLRKTSLAGATALAGCLESGSSTDASTPAPPLTDPPDGVYRPPTVAGVRLVGTAEASGFQFGVAHSLPSRFWEVVGRTGYRRDPTAEHDLHLMATVWDPETGVVLPEVGLTTEIYRDGTLVSEEAVYAMLSQRLGFHYGDNFALPGPGEYTVRVRVGGVQVRRTGAFEGRFADPANVEVTLQTDGAESGLDRETVPDAGTAGAVAADDSPVPALVVPSLEDLPGQPLGSGRTGDAVFEALYLSDDAAARFDTDSYLAIFARTPYNRLLLPAMGLRATLDGTEHRLTRTLDSTLGYHYGGPVAPPESGMELMLTTTTPPQIARHEGYETAFVEMPPVSLPVD